MPITGRSRGDGARQFVDHLNATLNRTVTQARLQMRAQVSGNVYVSFRHAGRPTGARVRTSYGDADLFLAQECSSEVVGGLHHLHTLRYTYTISPGGRDGEPLLRWEYVRHPEPEGAGWARHHLQGPVTLPWGSGISLNDLHLPTGFVPVEEVLRFCIHDLGVAPLSEDWNGVLENSRRRFKVDPTA